VRSLRSNRRFWLPFAIAALCLTVATWTGPILTWVMLFAAMGCIVDGLTLLWSRSGGADQHRQ
jgi:hypothetical protein